MKNSPIIFKGIFETTYFMLSAVEDIIQNKTKVFVQSLFFYNEEIIEVDNDLLKGAVVFLTNRP
jgi:hypothetical protein